MREVSASALSDRHEEIRNQLSAMDGWLEQLRDGLTDRRDIMRFCVAYLRRHILRDVAWEETSLFPVTGSAATILHSEHQTLASWVKELEEIAHADAPDAGRFQATVSKIAGLLEAHLSSEESMLAQSD